MIMEKTLFITTGATVVFEDLIKVVLTDEFLAQVVFQWGFTQMKLQFGVGGLGESLFLKKFPKAERRGKEWDVDWKSLKISGFAFTNDMNSVVSSSDLVISHAGTGSILDVLRQDKKLVVVINENLMDNHQSEIAKVLEDGGHLIKTTVLLENILKSLKKADEMTFTPLIKPKDGLLESILHQL